jgi:hypothetical protein
MLLPKASRCSVLDHFGRYVTEHLAPHNINVALKLILVHELVKLASSLNSAKDFGEDITQIRGGVLLSNPNYT